MTGLARWALLGPALFLVPLGACSSSNKAATAVQSAAQAQVNPTLSSTDANFINQAAAGGLAEVQLGQLASQKGTPRARRFGQQMVREHTPVNQQLTQLAQSKQITPSTTLDAPSQGAYDTLSGLRGHAFDTQYFQQQLTAHQDQLALFQGEAQNGTDPDVKAFAAQAEPTIRHHVDELQRLTTAGAGGGGRHRARPARAST